MVFTFTYNSPCSWIKIYAVCYCLHRDALAKEIYTQLFGWLISKVNNIIFKGKMQMSIAVLDIFGFEVSYVLRCKTCFDCWEAALRDPLVGSIFFVLLPLSPRCHDVDFIQEYLDLTLILKGFVYWATPWPPAVSSNCTVQQLFVFFPYLFEFMNSKVINLIDYFWVVIRFSKFQSFILKIYLLIFQFFP